MQSINFLPSFKELHTSAEKKYLYSNGSEISIFFLRKAPKGSSLR